MKCISPAAIENVFVSAGLREVENYNELKTLESVPYDITTEDCEALMTIDKSIMTAIYLIEAEIFQKLCKGIHNNDDDQEGDERE